MMFRLSYTILLFTFKAKSRALLDFAYIRVNRVYNPSKIQLNTTLLGLEDIY